MILVMTNSPCLGDISQLVSEQLRVYYITYDHIFENYVLTVRKHLHAHIRTIVVLTCDKLTEIYFPHLLSKLTIL
jgi:hypothetical protein